MKRKFRLVACSILAFAAIAGNSLPRTSATAAIHQATVPGPTPYCNPFTQVCPVIR